MQEIHLSQANARIFSLKVSDRIDDYTPTQNFLDITAKDLAYQMTYVEQYLFQQVNMSEYYLKRWEKDIEESKNLRSYIRHFNEVGFWVATTILTACNLQNISVDNKLRAEILCRWIQILEILKKMQNFNSCLQIYMALNMNIIDKLKNVWELVPKAEKDIIKSVEVLCQNNFREYRTILNNPDHPSLIPFHSIILQDLTHIEEMESIENGEINVGKLEILTRAHDNIRKYKTSHVYFIKEDTEIQAFISNKVVLQEEELQKIVEKLEKLESGGDPQLDSKKDTRRISKSRDMKRSKSKKKLPRKVTTKVSISKGKKKYSSTNVLEDVVDIPSLYEDFHQFLKAQFNDDKLECYVAMQNYSIYVNLKSDKCNDALSNIWNNYLKDGAPRLIIFNADIRDVEKTHEGLIDHDPKLFHHLVAELAFDYLKYPFTVFLKDI